MLNPSNPNKPLSPSSYVKGSPRQSVVRALRNMAKSPVQVKGYPSLSALSRAQNRPSVPPVDVQGEAQKLPSK